MRHAQEILIQNLNETLDLKNEEFIKAPVRKPITRFSFGTRIQSIRNILEVSRTISNKFPMPICPDKDTAFKTPIYWLNGSNDIRVLTLAQDGFHITGVWLDKELGALTHCGKFSKMNFLHAEKISRAGYNYFDCANAYAKTLLTAGFYLDKAESESKNSLTTFNVILPTDNTNLQNISFILRCPKRDPGIKTTTRIRFKKQYDDLQVVICDPSGLNEDYFMQDGADLMRLQLINAILDHSFIQQ